MDRGPADPDAVTLTHDRPPKVVAVTPFAAGAAGPVDPHSATIASDSNQRTITTAGTHATPGAPDALLGRALAHYRIDAPLGQGGMGVVYRAFDVSLERPIALKVLLGATPASRARFLREARAQARIRHVNVVPIHYVGEVDGTTFIAMDIVEGESLADRIVAGPVPVDTALSIVDAVAGALAAGWDAGLVHRDVKPSNILLDREGRALLADFGLAKESSVQELLLPEVALEPGPNAPTPSSKPPRPSNAPALRS